jgi:hypothetical protein
MSWVFSMRTRRRDGMSRCVLYAEKNFQGIGKKWVGEGRRQNAINRREQS